MVLYWLLVVSVWLCTCTFLFVMSQSYAPVLWFSVGIIAVQVTQVIVEAIMNATPRKLIQSPCGKAVLITGCDSGFGKKLALRLDALGFTVFAGCLSTDAAGAKSLEERSSERLRTIYLDVTNQESVSKAESFVRKDLESTGDRLWAIVNNAGIAALTEIEWCPLEEYQRMFDVNTLGVLRVTKTFLPMLRLAEGKRVVIVTSLAGRYTFPGFSAYSMSKHACNSFADALRLEMKKWNLTVHTVEPTLYSTNICKESVIQSNLEQNWNNSPDAIKKSYGEAYLQDFKNGVTKHLSGAKPREKIEEVVDDMLDAVAGMSPKCRYVPSLETQLKCKILSALPTNVLDHLMVKGQPKTPPADVEGLKKQERFLF